MSAAGAPDVLSWTEVADPRPTTDQLLVRVEAAGVNYIDVYQRTGAYPVELPYVPGLEGAGTVIAQIGTSDEFRTGDRVAWCDVPGSYGELLLVPVERAVPIPGELKAEEAAILLPGLTAHYLATDTFPLKEGDRCLVHAAAGGVGQLLVQVAKRRGAEVFATVGNAEKAELARSAGADHVIDYRATDFKTAVELIAGPTPLDVVYDGVGAATFDAGLSLLRTRGTMALYGGASGPVPPFDPTRLVPGSLYLTRTALADHIATTGELRRRATDIFEWLVGGQIRARIGSRFPLEEAARAHADLEARKTTGKVILVP